MRGVILSSWPSGAPSSRRRTTSSGRSRSSSTCRARSTSARCRKATSAGATTTTGKFQPTGPAHRGPADGVEVLDRRHRLRCRRSSPTPSCRVCSNRFPTLKFVSVEAGAGWVPWLLEQMDDRWWRKPSLGEGRARAAAQRVLPPQLAADVRAGLLRIRNRHDIGIDNMMWSTDYPHHISDWAVLPQDRERDVRRRAR